MLQNVSLAQVWGHFSGQVQGKNKFNQCFLNLMILCCQEKSSRPIFGLAHWTGGKRDLLSGENDPRAGLFFRGTRPPLRQFTLEMLA
ncbi:MAG: hypothetical protein LBJ82_05435 [Deltaproteobacteria bacterium]|jgi:hypothetical protein|nr:hypothetical protein [Deltaproteobacteria bacterium]